MANLYTVLPGLEVTSSDIQEAEVFAKQVLEAQFPDMDFREGTAIRDLTLRPTSFMLAKVKKALDYYFATNTLAGVNDTTDTSIVDAILSNWFLARNTGSNSVISARLFFTRPKTVSLTTDVYFSTDNALKFYPQQAAVYQADLFTYDSYNNEYYIDVNLVAEKADSSYDLSSGSLLYFVNFDPYFLHAEINYLSQSATAEETNTEFVTRSSAAISTRNLINIPSIAANLQATFNYLDRLKTIGYGDAEMLRDSLRAVITPESARTPTSMTNVGTTVTVHIPDHNFETGQIVVVSGAIPTGFNGTYSITKVDLSSFTYTIPAFLGTVSILPTIQSSTDPVMVHVGGKTDIYCSTKLATKTVQVTTDAQGKASVSGAVYSLARSQISGGIEEDTVPIDRTITSTNVTSNYGTQILTVTAADHLLVTGDVVSLSELSQTQTISAISCSNSLAIVTVTGHTLSTGATVTVSGINPTIYNGTYVITVLDANTFTYQMNAATLLAGSASSSDVSMQISNPLLNKHYSVTVSNSSTFTVSGSNAWNKPLDFAAATFVYSVPYVVSNPYLSSLILSSFPAISVVAGKATITYSNHGLGLHRQVRLSRTDNALFENKVGKIIEIVDQNNVLVDFDNIFTGTVSPSDHLKPIVVEFVSAQNDVGFSNRQILTIDFGSSQANKTASFNLEYFDYVDAVQSYLESADARVLCADPLARGFNIYVLNFDLITYSSSSYDPVAIEAAISSYLDALAAGDSFVLNDATAAITTAGLTGLRTPISVSFVRYTRDLFATSGSSLYPLTWASTGAITDMLLPEDITNVFVLGSVSYDTWNV